ncbi:MAG: ComF family protein [Pseudomonadota bacterium]
MQSIIKPLADAARHFLFPDACLTCNRHVAQHGALCAGCWDEIIMIDHPVCAVTGLPFSHDYGDDMVSAEALADPPDYTMARAAAVHVGTARQMVSRLKYHDQLLMAPLMARWIARAGRPILDQTDLLMPVPLHWRRFVGRRYNQAAELARHVSMLEAIELDTASLIRKRATKPQVGLTASARAANVRGSFSVREGHEINIQGRNITLIDDVYTTGATVNAAARALIKAKATNVFVLTFSRVVPGIHEKPKAIKKPFPARLQSLYRRK